MIFIGISTWTWCYALWSSIAILHDLDATFYDLQMAFPHDLDATFYDLQLAFPHEPDATLYDLHWHFHMNLMLRSMIFNCNSTWSWCYALWSSIGISTWSWCYALCSSIAIPHDLDATFFDLQLQFHMILMLRSMIFTRISTWIWCYALWSSIGIPHELDATLYDLHWHFHMNLMLRSKIFNVRKSCGCRFWGWSDGRVAIPKVDGPFFW